MIKISKLFFIIFSIIIILALIGLGYHFLTPSDNNKINSTQAIKNVLNDSQAAAYYKQHFHKSQLRVNNTTLVSGNVPNTKNVALSSNELIWKVNIMERDCACSGIRPLYVIEGYVSAQSGQCLNISTKKVNETAYPISTCASTLCH